MRIHRKNCYFIRGLATIGALALITIGCDSSPESEALETRAQAMDHSIPKEEFGETWQDIPETGTTEEYGTGKRSAA